MSKLTYEKTDSDNLLETFEWDRTWWSYANDNKTPRALFVGDSITCRYSPFVSDVVGDKILVDSFSTSKALDNPAFMPMVEMVMSQQSNYKIIVFNNGLHGFHLSEEEYGKWYGKRIKELREKLPEVKLIISLTTPIRKGENVSEIDDRNSRVTGRNAEAKKVAEEFGIETVDLYSLVIDKPEVFSHDGVHFLEAGYKLLAEKMGNTILKKIK
ncbi:MAG: GDSL-type esterase/lipase family protein [Monoglobales bacterium]